MSSEDVFLKATLYVKNLPEEGDVKLDNKQKLEMYALYKRATVGKCSEFGGSQPWFTQFEARAKWDAWNKVEDLSIKDAMEKYVELIKEFSKDSEYKFES